MKKLFLILFLYCLKISTITSQILQNSPGWPGTFGNGAFLNGAVGGTGTFGGRLNFLEAGTFGSNFIGSRYLSIGHNDINTIGSVTPNLAQLYGFTSTANSDRLFVGIMQDDIDGSANHSLINWGDDENDLLLFRHSMHTGATPTNNASFWAKSRSRFGPHLFPNALTTIPTTTLEIEQPIVPAPVNLKFLSGLRLRSLLNNTAAANLWTNPTNRFLTVDNDGYVVLSEGGSMNNCVTVNRVPRIINTNGELDCGIIRDDGTNVGIGVDGTRTLDVNGETRIRTLNNATTSRIVTADANGVLQAIAPATNPNDVLRGNGTWGPANAWNLNGNSGVTVPTFPIGSPIPTGVNYLGTQNVAPLVLATQQLERMRIAADGNVGIGTPNPSSALEVNGFITIDRNIDKKVRFRRPAANTFSFEHETSRFYLFNESTNSFPLTVLNNSNVGIGTPNPSSALEVNGFITIDRDIDKKVRFKRPAANTFSFEHETSRFYLFNESTNSFPLTVLNNSNIGINNTNPLNKLEVTGNFNTQQNLNTGNTSGLRLTDLDKLNRNLTVAQNTTGNVLTVDGDGDVILVNNQIGRECGSTTQAANLTHSRELPMSNFNFLFSDGGNLSSNSAQNNVGIGSFGNCNLLAKLDVRRLGVSTEQQRIGVRSQVSHSNQDEALSIAFDGITNTVNNTNIGARLNVSDGTSNTGTEISVNGGQQYANGANMVVAGGNADGIRLTVSGEQNTMGINATVNSNNNIATGMRIRNIGNPPLPYNGLTGNLGIDVNTNTDLNNSYPDFGILADITNPGNFDYAIFANGECFSTVNWTPSDSKLKKDVESIENALATLNKLNPKKYDFDDENIKYLNLSKTKENYGFIAQELEKVLPSLVKETIIPNRDKESKEVNKIKAVNYTELIPIAISAIKELNAKVEKQNNAVIENEALKSEIASLKSDNELMKEKFALLEKTITQLCESGCEGLKDKGARVPESSSGVDVLYQSIPNPTDSEALINYSLSKEYTNAYITVSTQEGKLLKSVKLDSKEGSGSIKLSLGELASGTYLYTLVAGERVIETKRLQILK